MERTVEGGGTMRRIKVSIEQAEVLLTPRGCYHMTLEQLFSMEKVIFPVEYERIVDGMKELSPFLEEKEDIFLSEEERYALGKIVSRNGKNLADVIGLDMARLVRTDAEEDGLYRLEITPEDPAYHQAKLLHAVRKFVSNIHFIDTVRGDVYIRCTISRWEQVAKRMKRTHSRNMDRSNRMECMRWVTYYYKEELQKHYLK